MSHAIWVGEGGERYGVCVRGGRVKGFGHVEYKLALGDVGERGG